MEKDFTFLNTSALVGHLSNTLTAAIFGVSFALMRQGTLVDGIFFTVLIFAGCLLSKNIESFVISLGLAIIISGVAASGSTKIIGVIPHVAIITLFVVVLILSIWILRHWISDLASDSNSRLLSLIVTGVASSLIWRWPVETSADYVGFLAPEDNAAWISTVTAFSRVHSNGFISGSGGFVLDPLMSLLYGIRSMGSSTSQTNLIYETVVATYGFIEFFALVAAGLFTIRVLKPSINRSAVRLTAGVAAVCITYIALQLARISGHLTFVGAVAMMNLMLLISTFEFIKSRAFVSLTFLLSLGVIGMWWPYLLVVGLAGLLVVSEIPKSQVRVFVSMYVQKPKSLILILGLGFLVLLAMLPIFINGFASMSPLDFLRVNGGVQPVPGYLTIFSITALSLFILQSDTNSQTKFVSQFGLSLGALLLAMQVATYFVGPTFVPRYSFNKALLLFAVSSTPLIPVVIAQLLSKFRHREVSAIFLILIFGVGNMTTGWDLNSPRSIAAPIWADQLITMSTKYPQAKILCSTSNPANNLEAYLCSRHSGAIQNQVEETIGSWGYLQVNPTPNENSTQLAEVKKAFVETRNRYEKIVIISLEDDFGIAEEDKWWMSQLPLDGIVISTPRGEVVR